MTLFLWDQSHYDGVITKAIMVKAKAEGIIGVHHKVGEGTGGDDPLDSTALAAARDAGIEFIGGYHVTRTGDVTDQVSAMIDLADRDEPWWRDFPGWFWVEDLERWSYDIVPAATGIACAKQLRDRTGKQTFLYASHGQYAGQLTAWDGPLWNADYVNAPAAGFKAMYPGDSWRPAHGSWFGGWMAYSGQVPTFLQYTSSAIIAGLTTCDANAYRGSVEALRALIQGGSMTTAQEVWGAQYKDYVDVDGDGVRPMQTTVDALYDARRDAYYANLKADTALARLDVIEAKLDALATAGVDLEAVKAAAHEGAATGAATAIDGATVSGTISAPPD